MRKMLALLITTAFILGTTGFAVAQTPAPAPTQEKKTDEKAMEKKPAKKAMSLEEKKEACLSKAGTNDAKKTKCEKQYETAKAKMEKKKATAEKKEEKK